MIIRMTGAQQLQKVDTAFAFRTFKIGKQLISDMRAVTIFALMPGPRVIHIDIARNLEAGFKNPVLFPVETVFPFDQEITELTGGNIDADFSQLLKQQRLRDMTLTVLVEDKPDQLRAEMPVRQIFRQLSHDTTPPRRGRLIYLEPIAGIERRDLGVLDHPILIAFEYGTRWYAFGLNGFLMVDHQFGGLVSLLGSRPFGLTGSSFLFWFLFQQAWLYLGFGRLILQPGDFIPELLYLLGLLLDNGPLIFDEVEQPSHKRALLILWN